VRPSELGFYATVVPAISLSLSDGYVYVRGESDDFEIIDISSTGSGMKILR